MTKIKDLPGWDKIKKEEQPLKTFIYFILFLIIILSWCFWPILWISKRLKKK